VASVRSGGAWGLAFGLVVAASAYSYTSVYDTPTKRAQLEVLFGSNHAISALFGPASHLETVAGFTVYKVGMTLMITGAIWGLLLATRLLRGEEDAGRSELLLLGRTTRSGAAAQCLVGLLLGVAALWGVTFVLVVLVARRPSIGFSAGAAAYFALAMVAAAALFAAVGALASQVASTRRQASSFAAVVLGLSYAVRMVADASSSLEWLRWASPLGWVEELTPLTTPRPVALVPLAGTTLLTAVAAVVLAGRRDVGSGLLAPPGEAPAHLRLLGSPEGLSVRLLRTSVLSWLSGIAVTALLVGYVARAAGQAVTGSSISQVLERLGAKGSGATTYLGLASLIVAVLVAFLAASMVVALRAEEADGRLEALLVRPVSRGRWLVGRLSIGLVALVLAGALAGLATWLGTELQGGGFRFGHLEAAGLNTVAPAVCVLGLGVAGFGLLPRRSTWIAWGIVVWSLLIEVVGGIGAVSATVVGTSVFHHMAPAPAVAPDWGAAAGLCAVGLLGMALGCWGFARRDLAGG
jgi:ABC-2 type transport system permease protein